MWGLALGRVSDDPYKTLADVEYATTGWVDLGRFRCARGGLNPHLTRTATLRIGGRSNRDRLVIQQRSGVELVAKSVAITAMGRLLRRPWYGWWRLVQRSYSGREYVLAVPQGQRIFSPWFASAGGNGFPELLSNVREHGRLTVSPDRCYVLYHYAREAGRRWPAAPMADCGVYTGGTAELISRAATTATLHLFDSFEGMPAEADPARDYHVPGDFSDTSVGAVRNRLNGRSCEFHVGFMPDTFAEVADVKDYSFIHVDVDIYTSVRDCVEYFWPRMAPGGVMIFDDYGFYPYRLAARRAVDEFFDLVPEVVLALPTGQGLVVKDT